jgi:hypothetical protein
VEIFVNFQLHAARGNALLGIKMQAVSPTECPMDLRKVLSISDQPLLLTTLVRKISGLGSLRPARSADAQHLTLLVGSRMRFTAKRAESFSKYGSGGFLPIRKNPRSSIQAIAKE